MKRDISDRELRALDEAGVRGVRFNFVKRLVDTLPREALAEIARRIQPLGWHIVIYFEAQELPELFDFFTSLPTIVVVDHMGRPDVAKPVDGPEFELFVKLMREHGNFWSKVSGAERLSRSGPPGYEDLAPFARRIVTEFPERVLWGTDWPHPNLKSHMPDDGQLVDFIPRIAPTAELQQKLLVENPMRLYWGEAGLVIGTGHWARVHLVTSHESLPQVFTCRSTNHTKTSPARPSSTRSSRARDIT